MKRLLLAGFALALLVPACAFAQSAFNGTWKLDPTTIHASGGDPMTVTLKNGVYHCNCHPPITVKADGMDHAVKGQKGVDTVAVKILNDHSVRETDKKNGKIVSTATVTVAANGKTATVAFTNHHKSRSASGKALFNRVAKGAPGSNAVAGSWRLDHYLTASGDLPAPTYKVTGDTFSLSDADGDVFTAKFGGKAVPFTNSGKADGTVSIKRLGKNRVRETYKKDGKVTDTTTLTVAANGKTLQMVDHDMKTGRTTTMTHVKQ